MAAPSAMPDVRLPTEVQWMNTLLRLDWIGIRARFPSRLPDRWIQAFWIGYFLIALLTGSLSD